MKSPVKLTLSGYRYDTYMLDIAKERNFMSAISARALVSILLFILFYWIYKNVFKPK